MTLTSPKNIVGYYYAQEETKVSRLDERREKRESGLVGGLGDCHIYIQAVVPGAIELSEAVSGDTKERPGQTGKPRPGPGCQGTPMSVFPVRFCSWAVFHRRYMDPPFLPGSDHRGSGSQSTSTSLSRRPEKERQG